MAQIMLTRTIRRYSVEFKFSTLIRYLNKNVMTIKVRARSMSKALTEAENILWSKAWIRRRGLYPRSVSVQCESWRPKREKQMYLYWYGWSQLRAGQKQLDCH